MRQALVALLGAALFAGVRLASAPQGPTTFPVSELRPGMVGIGRTVFSGSTVEEFRVHILGVLSRVNGPGRDLVLARLEGGPLEQTGVIQGMSGSPVYVDGRLVGALSYALGSFPKEPLAGITPIDEMTSVASSPSSRGPASVFKMTWPATPSTAYAALGRLLGGSAPPLGVRPADVRVTGPSALADLMPALRPIGAALTFSGLDPSVDRDLRAAINARATGQTPLPAQGGSSAERLDPGDAVGVSLVRGDLEIGATGTVTAVDGARVYAFGHPLLGLGPVTIPMTRARIYTVIPSLDSSTKVAALGPVVGTLTQDRATGIVGTVGAGPAELTITLTISSGRQADRRLQFKVVHDQTLTPLFAYVAVLNALGGLERQSGALTLEASGRLSFGAQGTVEIDDCYSGDGVSPVAASAVTAAIGAAAGNEFQPALPDSLDLTFRTSERMALATIERAWLDTTRPQAGATHTLRVLLRDYRAGTETIALPVTMPNRPGAVTLLVADGPTLAALEDSDLRPGRPTSWTDLLSRLNDTRRNNRLYVRLLASETGTVVGGATLPALPASVRSVFDEDKSVSTAPVARAVLGAWEQRFDRMIRGSRELSLVITDRK